MKAALGPSTRDFREPLTDYKIKEEIELSIRSIGPMSQNRQKKWRKISEQALQVILVFKPFPLGVSCLAINSCSWPQRGIPLLWPIIFSNYHDIKNISMKN